MKIRCLIVDDEPLAVEVIASYLEKLDGMEIAGSCSDALQALELLRKERIDLMFLDIQMPHIKGTEFLRTLSHPPRVILTTAYREYALEGFELDVVDYLLKPISFERFLKAVDKYRQSGPGPDPVLSGGAGSGEPAGRFIQVKSDRKRVRLPVRDILYIEGMKDYIRIVTTGRTVIMHGTLQELETMLPPPRFLRIHRSCLVPVRRITAFTHEMVEIGDKQLPVGRHYRRQVMDCLSRET